MTSHKPNHQISELKLQQEMFTWHWNNKPGQRGRLFMIHNTPQNAIQGALLKGAGMIRGIPDFMYLLHNGRYLFIEIKNEAYQSLYQKWFEACVNLLNGYYVVCYSLEMFQEIIKNNEGEEISLPAYPNARV